MAKKLAVIPELCSGCRLCELACAIGHFGVNNPKKSAVRVLVTYPQPVLRMPIVCSQCKVPVCAEACPVGALKRTDGVVHLDTETCVSCMKCVEACPFGAVYAHGDVENPIKCDLCDGRPQCVDSCPINLLHFTTFHEFQRIKQGNSAQLNDTLGALKDG